jgi:hypothetical protein
MGPQIFKKNAQETPKLRIKLDKVLLDKLSFSTQYDLMVF